MNKKNKKSMSLTRKKMYKKLSVGVLALITVLTMVISLASQEQVYAYPKMSNDDTTKTYTDSLGGNASTQYAGRVWTDKTVYSGDATFTGDVGTATIKNDSDFLVAYSALATSQSISGQTQVPLDVVQL